MSDVFISIKEKVQNLININKSNEVTNKTNYTASGIYMLYVDNFSDDSIIPFYIGETGNFQERHKEHLKELLSLNRLNYETYKHYLITGFYDGNFKACKIFTYLVNHNCTLKNFHMIILEEIDDTKKRKQKELFYINDLHSPFFGFNQLNSLSKIKEYENIQYAPEYQEFIENDITNLCLYHKYGYSTFNCYLSKGVFSPNPRYHELTAIDCYSTLFQYKKQKCNNEITLSEIRNIIRTDCHLKIVSICNDDISTFFEENNLKSLDKKKDIISAIIFNDQESRTRVNKYIKNFVKKEIDIVEMLLNKHEQINIIKKNMEALQEKFKSIEEENWRINEKILFLLIPQIHYNSHPLKDMYEEHEFLEPLDLNNVCYINIEYTSFKSNIERDSYPEICKIDYLFIKDDCKKSRTAFIENQLSNFLKNDELYYLGTKNIYNSNPFKIQLYGAFTEIPVSMEYRNGINEFTINNKTMENVLIVFKEIDALIDDKTKIIYTTSGYKSTIKRYSNITNETPNRLLKKLIRTLK